MDGYNLLFLILAAAIVLPALYEATKEYRNGLTAKQRMEIKKRLRYDR